jgi:putative phosphonate catabolism associated alcohol dehydrogenase
MVKSGRLAVYDAPGRPFELRSYPLRPPRAGEALVKIRMSTICRSDIHSYLGHRPNPCPGILGHEIIGDVVSLGSGVTHDMRGDALAVGDRVTWSEYFIPPSSSDALELPQKAPGVDKYGHMAVTTDPHHHGGFGEYCYILPRSWILKLPPELTDEEATPINCGVATVMCIVEKAEVARGDTVVVQGLGLLGIYAAAVCKAHGARRVIGVDTVAARRELATRFGVDQALADMDNLEAADVVIEVCGNPEVIAAGIQALRTGGRYVLGGVVNPESYVRIDANQILRKLVTLRGVHNYHPRNLAEALDFVLANRKRYPFHDLVDGKYRLDEVGTAMQDAADRRVLRAAIVP